MNAKKFSHPSCSPCLAASILFLALAARAEVLTNVSIQIISGAGQAPGAALTSCMIMSDGTSWSGGAVGVQGTNNINDVGGHAVAANVTFKFNVGATVDSLNATYGEGHWTMANPKLAFQYTLYANNPRFNAGPGAFAIYWVGNDTWIQATNNPVFATNYTTLLAWATNAALLGSEYYSWTTPNYTGTTNDLNTSVWVTDKAGNRQATNVYSLTDDPNLVQDITSASAGTNAGVSLYLMATSDTVGLTIFTGGANFLPTLSFDVIPVPQGETVAVTATTNCMPLSDGTSLSGGLVGVQGAGAYNNIGGHFLAGNGAFQFNLGAVADSLNATYGAGNWTIANPALSFQYTLYSDDSFYNSGPGAFDIYWVGNDQWSGNLTNSPVFATNAATLSVWATNEALLASANYDWTTPDYAGTLNDLGSSAWTATATGLQQATNFYSLSASSGFVGDVTSASAASNNVVSLYLMAASDSVGLTIFSGAGTYAPTLSFQVVAAPKGAPPAITAQPSGLTVNSGDAAAFAVSATGNTPLAYQWFFDGSPVSGATAATLNLSPVTTQSAGSYFVVITNLYGCATSDLAALTVIPAVPVITAAPLSLTVAAGGSAGFSVAATGINPLTYQWYFNGSTLNGATAANLTIVGVAATNAGGYFVVVSNSYGSATSSVAWLMVITPPVLTSIPTNQQIGGGGTVSLQATAAGAGPIHYQWFKNGRWLVAGTNSALTWSNASVADSGTYYVVATNQFGMNISQPVLVSVANPDVLGWGYNGYYGQLGDGTTNHNRLLPEELTPGVVAAAVGQETSYYLGPAGTLWAIGANSDGQLGTGNFNNTQVPVAVASNVVAVSAGQYHLLFVTADGVLWASGLSYFGQLGVPVTNINVPLQTSPVSVASNVVAVAAGADHSLYLTADGVLWTMGFNLYGQLGNGTKVSTSTAGTAASNVVAIAAGGFHSLFIKTDASLWTMGFNLYGQLGDGNTSNSTWPELVATNVAFVTGGYEHSLAVQQDGRLWTMGFDNRGQLGRVLTNDAGLPLVLASNVVTAAAGYYHSLFLKNDGSLWTVGYNACGQLGNGTTNDALTPIQVPGMTLAEIASGNYANYSLAVGAASLPTITKASRATPGVLSLRFAGLPGGGYWLETATNLTQPAWVSISTNTAGNDGTWQFTDTNAAGPTPQFYRVHRP